MLVRVVLAFSVALVFAIPTLFESIWEVGWTSIAAILLNLPGILCGVLFGGRFFPPEGYIEQSVPRWILMLLVQAVVWYFILWFFRFVIAHSKKPHSDATRSI
jgi:hypothetical protein